MNVVDSSAWLEYFGEGRNAGHFAGPIQDIKNLIVPSICIYEVFKRSKAQRGEMAAMLAISTMSSGLVVDFDADLAIASATISLQQKLSMADSIVLAVARKYNATLWTQDADFKGLERVKYFEAK